MTLREKLKSFAMDNHIKEYAELNSKNLEDIADEFAIDFANWLNNRVLSKAGEHYRLNGKLKVSEFLYLYKKEKKLLTI